MHKPDDPKLLSWGFDLLLLLLIIIIIVGGILIVSLTKHGLCARKGIHEEANIQNTNLEQTLGRNPSFDLLKCK